MLNYLHTEDIDIQNYKRTFDFSNKKPNVIQNQTLFWNMYIHTICEGCRAKESNVKHTLECTAHVGPKETITYLPHF